MSEPRRIVTYIPYATPPPIEDHRHAVFAAEQGSEIQPVHRAIGNLLVPYELLPALEAEVAAIDPHYDGFAPLGTGQASLSDSDIKMLYTYERTHRKALPPLVRELISTATPLFYASIFEHSAPLRELYGDTHVPSLNLLMGPYNYNPNNAPHRDTAGGTGTVTYTATLLGPPTVFSTKPFIESDFDEEMFRWPLAEPKSYPNGTIIMHDGVFAPHAAPDQSLAGAPRIFLQAEFTRSLNQIISSEQP